MTRPSHLVHLLLALFALSLFPWREGAAADPLPLIPAAHLYDLTGDLYNPSDVAVSADGHVYVVDGVNHRVVVFDARGRRVSSFGGEGSKLGKLQSPLGVAVGASGRIYVADSGNHRIQVFSPGGSSVGAMSLPGGGRGAADPTDVAVDEAAGVCFAVDNDNHQVVKLDLSTGAVLATIGSYGSARRQFRHPFLVERGPDKNLYVVETIGTRLQVIGDDGRFVDFIGGWGVERGEFFRPKGVGIDRAGRVFVSDSYLGVIQVFSPTGAVLGAIGDAESGKLKKFSQPVGLFVDADDHLYVVEMSSDRVRVYQLAAGPGTP